MAAEQAVQSDLERDELWFDRLPALAFCLSVIPRVTPEGMLFAKPEFGPIGSKPEGKLFRIML